MPWPKEHKVETRNRIVDAATTAFLGEGVDGVSVASVMASAGLTHGGFYAHFQSKDELLAEALANAASRTLARLDSAQQDAPASERLLAAADVYLSAPHLEHPELGCPIAALGPEVTRGSRKVRRRFAAGIRTRLDWLRDLLPRRLSEAERERRAAGALACMVGGMVLARALGDDDATRLLADCRAFLRDALA